MDKVTKRIKIAISVLLFAGVLIWLFLENSRSLSFFDLRSLPMSALGFCLAALILSNLLAIVRMRLVAGALGYRIPWPDSAAALSVGALGGAIFFQIAGQIIGRNVILARHAVPPGAVVLITAIERALAFLVAFSLAAVGVWQIYGRAIVIDLDAGGNALARTAVGGIFVMAVVSIFCWRRQIIDACRQCTATIFIGAAIAFVLSVAIQLTTMAAYISIALPFATATPLLLPAAVAIIMFLASVPISFGGWGVRELSAVAAFGAIGMAANAAFMVGALIGIFSILIVLVIAAVSSRMLSPRVAADSMSDRAQVTFSPDKALAPLAAVLVCFSIYVPVNAGLVNVTLADPLVIVGAGLFLFHCWALRTVPPWGPQQFNAVLLTLTFVVMASFGTGVLRFGLTAWASTKATGWFVLLSYLATGALAVRLSGLKGTERMIWPFVVAATSIVSFDLFLTVLRGVVPVSALMSRTVDYSGFSNNRNAFAFLLLLAVGGALAMNRRGALIAAAISSAGILLSGSRTGMLCMIVVFAIAFFLQFTRGWHLGLVALAAVSIYAATGVGVPLLHGTLPLGVSINDLIEIKKLAYGASGQQHWQTIVSGLEMFLAFPVFGAGLGAFMETVRLYATPIVIHSTPVWILAEMGLVGFAVFALAVASAVAYLWTIRDTFAGKVGLCAFAVAGMFGLSHEILYQRPLWLILGAVLYMVTQSDGSGRKNFQMPR